MQYNAVALGVLGGESFIVAGGHWACAVLWATKEKTLQFEDKENRESMEEIISAFSHGVFCNLFSVMKNGKIEKCKTTLSLKTLQLLMKTTLHEGGLRDGAKKRQFFSVRGSFAVFKSTVKLGNLRRKLPAIFR